MLVTDIQGVDARIPVDSVARDLQAEYRLPHAVRAPDDHEFAAPEPTVEYIVQRIEAGSQGTKAAYLPGGHPAISLLQHVGQRCRSDSPHFPPIRCWFVHGRNSLTAAYRPARRLAGAKMAGDKKIPIAFILSMNLGRTPVAEK